MKTQALTFLRFMAALIVVIFHYGNNTYLPSLDVKILTSGPEMVTFFFVLSGFVMLVSHYQKENETFRNYFVSRIARIAPVYILALGLIVFLTSSGNNIGIILSTTFLQAWVSPYPLSLNAPSWAVSVEMFFYLTFPLIFIVVRKYSVRTRTFMIFSLLVYLITQVILSRLMAPDFYKGFPSFSHDIIYYFPISHYCSFLLGIAGGLLYIRNRNIFHSRGLVQFAIFFGVIFSVYYLFQNRNLLHNAVGYPLAYGSSFYSLIFIIFILGFSCSENLITKILRLPIMIFMGEISYSLYILQNPVYIIYKRYITESLELGANSSFCLYLTLLIAVASISFLLIERPCKSGILKLNFYISELMSNKSIQQTATATDD